MGMQSIPMSTQAELAWKKQILTCYHFLAYKILEIATRMGFKPDQTETSHL